MSIITENSNPQTWDIDMQNGYEIARLINAEDKNVALAVEKILPQIGLAIDKITERLRGGGRMAYFGAGTSGRIGILDASEMPPTFGVSPDMIRGYIAGGEQAVRNAVENAEDNSELAKEDFNSFNPQKNDVIIAISASGNPVYTMKILQMAKSVEALSIAVTSNPEAAFKPYADIFLCVELGAEAVTGSSRMKSGTAQKMILNMLSTGAMVSLGKTYHNYMIDLQINNAKLRTRAVNIIKEICATDEKTAQKTLDVAGNVKTACVMIIKNCDKEKAEALLKKNDGILRRII